MTFLFIIQLSFKRIQWLCFIFRQFNIISQEILQHDFGVFFTDSNLLSLSEFLGKVASFFLEEAGGALTLFARLLMDIILIASVGLVL